MLHKKRYAFALLGMMVLPGVNAQARDLQPYLGVGLGAFGLEVKDNSIPGVAFSQKNTVFGGFLKGGVDINDYIGAELRVGTTAQGSKAYAANALMPGSPAFTYSMKAQYFISYLAKLQYPVSPEFRLYAMLGGTTARLKNNISVPGLTTVPGAVTKTGFSFGAGGDYAIDDQFSLGAEWMQYLTNVTVAPNVKVKAWGAVVTGTAHF